eukprot:1014350-Prymnesium_polylepis.2
MEAITSAVAIVTTSSGSCRSDRASSRTSANCAAPRRRRYGRSVRAVSGRWQGGGRAVSGRWQGGSVRAMSGQCPAMSSARVNARCEARRYMRAVGCGRLSGVRRGRTSALLHPAGVHRSSVAHAPRASKASRDAEGHS